MSASEDGGPLAGVRIIDLTINVLGPVGTQILGDMGAEVIKIEAPGGDPMRQIGPNHEPNMGALYLNMNRNKRSVVLNLKSQEGLKALARLVETADVFVHNMRLDAADRLGIDYGAISAIKPDIVYAAASGYAKDGPQRDRPAYDDVIQGEGGFVNLIDRANGEARFMPMPATDKLVGYVLASSIGMALFRRERTGKGQEVHVPMLETVLSFTMVEHLWGACIGKEDEFGLGYPRMMSPNRRPYPTKDGFVCLLSNTDEQWRRMLNAVDLGAVAEDPKFKRLEHRMPNIAELLDILAKQLSTYTTAELRARLDSADIPNGEVASLEEILASDYLAGQNFFPTVSPTGEPPIVTTAVPVSYSESPGAIRYSAPRLAQDAADILGEVGYGPDEIEQLTND
jgi:crotonobetainyl-CoA:carnitine CoA-transferase CaiB-like acyl-CoA transferase